MATDNNGFGTDDGAAFSTTTGWPQVGAKEGIGGATPQAPEKPPVQNVTRSTTGKNLDPVRGN